jgi:hypothetical protein
MSFKPVIQIFFNSLKIDSSNITTSFAKVEIIFYLEDSPVISFQQKYTLETARKVDLHGSQHQDYKAAGEDQK